MSSYPAPRSRPAPARAGSGARRVAGKPSGSGADKPRDADHEILFQTYFKSVNPRRTYAVQVKRAGNKNHYLVLTEGKRDDKTDELRLARLFLFSEDFSEFFKLMKAVAEFIKANPVPDEVKRRRAKFWATDGAAGRPKQDAGPRRSPPSHARRLADTAKT